MIRADSTRHRRTQFAVVMVLVATGLATIGSCRPAARDEQGGGSQTDKAGSGSPDLSSFDRALSGTWQMLDASTDVLKEPREAGGPAERERWLVRSVPERSQLRIIAARQQWKQVEVIERGAVVAGGWVDAQRVKNARLIAKTDPDQPTLLDGEGRDLLGQIVPASFKNDVTLETAFMVFSMFGVKIELDPSVTPQMRQQQIRPVAYENASLREALTAFCSQYGLRWDLEGKQIVVRKKP